MATWDDVRRIALGLPDVAETRPGEWRAPRGLVVWERPLRKADLEFLGDDAPTGPILGARTPDVETQQALVTEEPEVFFVTPHFHGYPGVLVLLDAIDADRLEELVVEAWSTRVPAKVAGPVVAERARLARERADRGP
ncbi:protein of unknown function DUF661 [Beutenbergia cavernae DSM 12333]|uniref:MmcQ/YjbR family DNA-binding protein n=1 Tax=Beutenbergia cavernae (strain ATCC BAA-8 / DSM 12333 / CCUG 43141 / JCM 11478 / NBRC 16432 / NCIMB 13614 / HKI 0122) TaxID=471853 RepID=C5C2J8_BEUC1|nr:hypothetical protein [Beutenbergia cavernae]ACQ79684.1 protein of unknown function DUF661 [Beutenbergia cavernae DSM 12333]